MKLRIPLKAVFCRQLQTYGGDTDKRKVWVQYKMLGLPFVLSAIMCFVFGFNITSQTTTTLITVMAIFIPLLFTALISLHDTRQNLRSRIDIHPSETSNLEYLLDLYEHLADNVSFVLGISIVELILLIGIMCFPASCLSRINDNVHYTTGTFINVVVFYLLQVILYHIVFIIERMASLVKVTA